MFLLQFAWFLIFWGVKESLSRGLGDECSPVDATLFCDDPLTVCQIGPYLDHECQCVEESFEFNRTTCAHFPKYPKDPCHNSNAPCTPSVPNSQCRSGACECITDYLHDTVNRRCLKNPTSAGDICEPNSVPWVPCSTLPAVTACQFHPTMGEFICECSSPEEVTDIQNHVCLKKPSKPGELCTPNLTPCTGVTNTSCVSVGSEFKCQCVSDLVTNPTEGECLIQPRRPGESCHQTWTPCTFVSSTICGPHPDIPTPICTCTHPQEATDYENHECIKLPQFPGDSCHPKFARCDLDPIHLPSSCLSDDAVSFYCKCDAGSVNDFVGRRCLSLPQKIGDECSPFLAPCDSIQDAVCREEDSQWTCLCNGDLITDKVNGRCLVSPTQLNDPCEPTIAPCTSAHLTQCDPSLLTCQCIPPHIPFLANLTCLPLPQLPGDLCDLSNSLTCQNIPQAPNCALYPSTPEFVCTCDVDLLDRPNRRCIPPPQYPLDLCHPITAPCTNVPLTVCKSHVGTSDFKCFCNEGLAHDPQAKRCIAPPNRPGDPCEPLSAPCTPINNTSCVWEDSTGHTCKCEGSLVTEHGYCFPHPSKPGDQCSVSLAPCPPSSASTCVDSGQLNFFSCKCDGGDVVTDPEFHRCVRQPTLPLQPCDPSRAPCPTDSHTQCSLLDSSSGYFCTCVDGFVHDAAGTRCIPPPLIPGDPCEPSLAPCSSVANTSCTADPKDPNLHSCWCRNSQVTDLGRCFPPPTRPSHSCSTTQAEGSCPTSTLTECVLHSSPPNNFRCICSSPGYFTDFLSERCVPFPTFPGDPCSPSGDSPCPPNSTCSPNPSQGSYCKCLDGYFLSSNGACVGLPTRPEGYCEIDAHCSAVTGTLCLNKSCECIPGEWDLSGLGSFCVKKARLLDDPCETSLQCSKINSSSCVGSVCGCAEPFFPSETKENCLSPVETLNLPCLETSQCFKGIGQGSICLDSSGVRLCSCDYGYVPSSSGRECLKAWDPEESCDESSQCRVVLGEMSECDWEGRCVCTEDAVLVNATCVLKRSVGQSCSQSGECVLWTNGFGVCSSLGVCECGKEVSFEANGMCWKRLRLGSPCLIDLECVKSLDNPRVFCHLLRKVCSCPVPGTCGSGTGFLRLNLNLLVALIVPTLYISLT